MIYFDILCAFGGDYGFDVVSKIYQILHGINSNNDEKFALDFKKHDDGFVFRVFSQNDNHHLKHVKNELSKNRFVGDYVIKMGRIRKCPATKLFVENRRRKIPKKQAKDRERRLEYCKTLLHFKMNSKSNGHKYAVYSDTSFTESPIANVFESNYGLSTAHNTFTVPLFL